MDLNYDTIIKYLVKNNNSGKNDYNKKFILTYSDKFPQSFSDIFQNKFYKYGVTVHNSKKNNISFYTSLITLLNDKFSSYSEEEDIDYVTIFNKSITEELKTFTPSIYLKKYIDTNKLSIKDLINNQDIYFFQTIVEILDINIIILNFDTNNYNILYPDEKCNPWKVTLLLAYSNNYWEPIIFENKSKKTFYYDDLIIKKILSGNNITYFHGNTINKHFLLNENFNEIINSFIPINEYVDENIFVKVHKNNYEFATLNKMTKIELTEICKSKNLKTNTKMLKKEIIDLILNN